MKRIALLIPCLCLVGMVSPASALMLYGVSYDEQIWRIDRTTGAIDLYKNTPGLKWFGATDGPSDESFFATGDGGSLFKIDIAADTVTPIGTYGGSVRLRSLAYADPVSPATEGILYGSDYQNLYTIDPATGVATLVGPIKPAGELFVGVWSMDYDPVAQALFITNLVNNPVTHTITTKLYTVNPANAEATLVGEIAGAIPIADIWYDRDSGKMFGVTQVNGQLYEIDTATAGATPIGTAPGENILGLAGAMIPEPGMLMLLGLGAMGVLRTGRRSSR